MRTGAPIPAAQWTCRRRCRDAIIIWDAPRAWHGRWATPSDRRGAVGISPSACAEKSKKKSSMPARNASTAAASGVSVKCLFCEDAIGTIFSNVIFSNVAAHAEGLDRVGWAPERSRRGARREARSGSTRAPSALAVGRAPEVSKKKAPAREDVLERAAVARYVAVEAPHLSDCQRPHKHVASVTNQWLWPLQN